MIYTLHIDLMPDVLSKSEFEISVYEKLAFSKFTLYKFEFLIDVWLKSLFDKSAPTKYAPSSIKWL